jgi:hypothetical protein
MGGIHTERLTLPVLPVEHLDLEVAHEQHVVLTFAVDVLDLEGRVVGEEAVARVGAAGLPEHLALQRDGGERADVIERVALHARDVLGDEHVHDAVAVEIAEAHVASSAELGRGQLAPQLGQRVAGAQLGEVVFARLDSGSNRVPGAAHALTLKA